MHIDSFSWRWYSGVFWSRMVRTLIRKRWYHLRVQSPFFCVCVWYILFLDRENITASPKFVCKYHSAFQPRFLSIVQMNVWLWNSDWVFAVALVNCFPCDLKFWTLRPSISRWFSPIRHFAKTGSAFRPVLQKEFGNRLCFSFRHV